MKETKLSRIGKNIKIGQGSLIFLYLAAIVTANLITAWLGPRSVIIGSFFLIGLDLTSRDRLHEIWNGRGIVWKMGALIAAGSLISYALNRSAGQIALASMIAFAAAALVDSIIYQLLHGRDYMVKVNGSNVFGALTDSLIFPTVAFGGFLPWITLGQFMAKVLGGFFWSIILRKAGSPGDRWPLGNKDERSDI